MKLYLESSGSGLSLVPELKYEHVYLMRVDLAAQVYIHVHVRTCVQMSICTVGVHYQEYIFIGNEFNSGRGSTLDWRRGSQGNCQLYPACGQIL